MADKEEDFKPFIEKERKESNKESRSSVDGDPEEPRKKSQMSLNDSELE